jgi:hypothetical protein
MKEWYIKEIVKLLEKSNDLSLMDFVLELLHRS